MEDTLSGNGTAHDAAQHAMMVNLSGGDPSALRRGDQAKGLRFEAVLLLVVLAIGACSRADPIEQARIAAGRAPTSTLPPVPGEGAPYPNLGTVPARPETTAPEARQALAESLVADRANARYIGQPVVPTVPRAAPATTQTPPSASAASVMASPGGGVLGAVEEQPPPLGAVAPPPIAGAPLRATDPVATASPPPSSAPMPEPVRPQPASPITTEPLNPPPPAMPDELPAQARTAAIGAIAAPREPERQHAPAEAERPPPLPVAPVVETPLPRSDPSPAPAPVQQVTIPARPSAPPPAPIAPSVIVDRTALQPQRSAGRTSGYALSFLPGTTAIASADRAMLGRLAASSGGATFRVTGFADEQGTGRALDLPIARARAVADALRAAGVAADAIELGGEARPGPAGRGAEVTLVYSR
jgi:outer membrane protein OmpA-like peptidoglycan-associated protein